MALQEIFRCMTCPKSFTERRRLTQHQKTHRRPDACKLCPKSFPSKTDLSRHINSVHVLGRPRFRCNVEGCIIDANRKDNLVQHRRREHATYLFNSRGESNSRSQSQDATDKNSDIALSLGTPEGPAASESSWMLLMAAATNGNVPYLEFALQMGLNINTVAEDGYTALHCAARAGHVQVIEFLLQKGATLDQHNEKRNGERPIHEAIIGNHPNALRTLLQAGAKIEPFKENGRTIVEHVVKSNNIDVARALVDELHGRQSTLEIGFLLLRQTVKAGSVSLLKWLLSNSPQCLTQFQNHKQSHIYLATKYRRTEMLPPLLFAFGAMLADPPGDVIRSVSYSLLLAVRSNMVQMVEVLLESTVIDFHVRDAYRQPALWYALYSRPNETLRLFLRHASFDVNAPYESGDTALHFAIKKGKRDMIDILLSTHNINIQCADRNGYTPLEEALYSCQFDIVEKLAKVAGIEPEHDLDAHGDQTQKPALDTWLVVLKQVLERHDLTRGSWRWTKVINEMAQSGAVNCAKLFLQQPSFVVNYYDYTRRPVLHNATEHQQIEILKLFLEHPGIKVNVQEYYNDDTALHTAVRHDSTAAFKLLLAHKDIDLTIRNCGNKTALDLAIQLNRSEMVQLLLDAGARQNEAAEPWGSSTVDSHFVGGGFGGDGEMGYDFWEEQYSGMNLTG